LAAPAFSSHGVADSGAPRVLASRFLEPAQAEAFGDLVRGC
jgi:hypothetical protein